jgi:hypothetical protein
MVMVQTHGNAVPARFPSRVEYHNTLPVFETAATLNAAFGCLKKNPTEMAAAEKNVRCCTMALCFLYKITRRTSTSD